MMDTVAITPLGSFSRQHNTIIIQLDNLKSSTSEDLWELNTNEYCPALPTTGVLNILTVCEIHCLQHCWGLLWSVALSSSAPSSTSLRGASLLFFNLYKGSQCSSVSRLAFHNFWWCVSLSISLIGLNLEEKKREVTDFCIPTSFQFLDYNRFSIIAYWMNSWISEPIDKKKKRKVMHFCLFVWITQSVFIQSRVSEHGCFLGNARNVNVKIAYAS